MLLLIQSRRRSMSTEEHPISDNDENEAAREEHSFDELAKRLASKTISRRGALKLVGAALWSGVLCSLFTLPAGAQSNSVGGSVGGGGHHRRHRRRHHCGPKTCNGCCDAGGHCREGTSKVACGSGGHACVVCSDNYYFTSC